MEKRSLFDLETLSSMLAGTPDRRAVLGAAAGGVVLGGATALTAEMIRDAINRKRASKRRSGSTTDESISIVLPEQKKLASAYDAMASAKCGTTRLTTKCGRQTRDHGRFGEGIGASSATETTQVQAQCAEKRSQATGSTLALGVAGGLTGGILAYGAMSRIMSELRMRRMERALAAAESDYESAVSSLSKESEYIRGLFRPAEVCVSRISETKSAEDGQPATRLGNAVKGTASWFSKQDPVRIPAAIQLVSYLLAAAGSAYLTKKTLDRSFPHESLGSDYNSPPRITFRTRSADAEPMLMTSDDGSELKEASDTVKVAAALAIPIYMDAVEGKPSRVLDPAYVKFASEIGTTPEALVKMAAGEAGKLGYSNVVGTLLSRPDLLWHMLKKFFGNMSWDNLNAGITALTNGRGLRGLMSPFFGGSKGFVNAVHEFDPNLAKTLAFNAIDNSPGGWKTAKKVLVDTAGAPKALEIRDKLNSGNWSGAAADVAGVVVPQAWNAAKSVGGQLARKAWSGVKSVGGHIAEKAYVPPSLSAGLSWASSLNPAGMEKAKQIMNTILPKSVQFGTK